MPVPPSSVFQDLPARPGKRTPYARPGAAAVGANVGGQRLGRQPVVGRRLAMETALSSVPGESWEVIE